MSEEITIKISVQILKDKAGKIENREIDIKINQNATVNDLVEKIKENKELVNGNKYLYLEFNKKVLIDDKYKTLCKALKDYGIGDNSILTAALFPFCENFDQKDLQCLVDISDEIHIEIKKSDDQRKKISLNKNEKYSDLLKLIKNDKDIKNMAGNNKYFLLMFGGQVITGLKNMEKTLEELNIKDQSVINIGFNIGFNNEKMSDKWVEIKEQNENKQEFENKEASLKTSEINSLNLAQNTETHRNKEVTSKIETTHNNSEQYHEDDEFGCFFKRNISWRSRLWFSFKLIFCFAFVGKYPVSSKNSKLNGKIGYKIIRFFIAVLLITNILMLALGVTFLCLSMLTKLAIAMTVVGTFLSVIFVCSCFVISAKLNSKISSKELKTLDEFPVGYSSRDSIVPISISERRDISNVLN